MPRPVLQAMVLADHVYQDRLSGKYIIAGTFGRIGLRVPQAAQQPPAAAAPLPAPANPPASPAAASPRADALSAVGQPTFAGEGLPSPVAAPSEIKPPEPKSPESKPPERTTQSLDSAIAQISVSGSPFLYLALTGIHGRASLTIRFVNLSDFASLFDAILDVTSADPVALSEYCVPLPPLPCTKPGTYSIDLLHAGELLGSWRLVAVAS